MESAMSKIVTFNKLGKYGRFANGMFQIAGTIGVARKNGFDFAFPRWMNYDHKDRFGSTEDIDLQKYFVNPLPIYNGPKLPNQFIHWGYHDIKLHTSVSLEGHLQSLRYFEHCLDEVRWYFKMHHEPPLQDYCAIHIRLGDYDNKYHPRLDERYYKQAIELIPKDIKLLVFSDDRDAAQIMMYNILGDQFYRFYMSGEKDYIHDFAVMKSCRHFIIGNSSYSAMAAILGEASDKIVVSPSADNWFGASYTNITGADIVCKGWKQIKF